MQLRKKLENYMEDRRLGGIKNRQQDIWIYDEIVLEGAL